MPRNSVIGAAALCIAVAGLSWMYGQQNKTNKLTADDYIEIQQLYHNYARAIDIGEGEKFAATFIEDGEFTGGRGPGRANDPRTPAQGHDALYRIGDRSGTRHFTANLVVTPTAEGVKGSCYLLLYSARTVPPSFVETAIYDDTLVKTPQGWKFKKRVVWRDDDDITPFKPKPLPERSGKEK
jgi:3-phenylpropionate/cinnamic acid dioxygenase small subunit